MPKVPVQTTQTQITSPGQARLNVTATPEDFGAAEGRAISQTAGTFNAFAERAKKMKQDDDLNAAKDAFVASSDKTRAFLNGDGGIYSKRGRDALGTVKLTDSELDKISGEAQEFLTNDTQREAFSSLWNRHRSTSLDGVSRHEMRQRNVANVQTTEAMLADSLDNALNNFTDQESINESIENTVIAIRTNGQGQSEEVMTQQIDAAISNIHKGVIDRMLVDDPKGAREYFSKNKNDVEGKDNKIVEAALKAGILRGDAQEKTDKIMADIANPADQLKEARAIRNPELRDETVMRVKLRQKDDAALVAANNKQLVEGGWAAVEQGLEAGTGTDDLLKMVDKMPTHKDRENMRKFIDKKVSGEDIVTDPDLYYRLRVMSMDEPGQFKKTKLTDFYADLSLSDRERLIDLQQRIGPDGDTAGRTLNQMVTQSLRSIGIDTGAGAGKPDKKLTSTFWRKVEDELVNFKEVNGREANRSDQQAVIDNLIIEGEVKGRTPFLDPDVRLFQVEEGQEFFIEEVPKEERAEIIEALKRKNLPVTNDAIVSLWTQQVTQKQVNN